ncbi:MAG: hypothetical protein ACFFC7_09125 [Candidatus Hermodarchaeota archaeon]
MQWSQTYGGVYSDYASALIQTTDGGYALAGGTGLYDPRGSDYWLVKTDSNGTAQWNQTYRGKEDDEARTLALIQTTDGGYALAGGTSSYGAGGSDFWLVKTDSQGIPQWNQTYGGVRNDYAEALIQTTDGGYALAGRTGSFGAGRSDFWLVKTDGSTFPITSTKMDGLAVLITVLWYLAIVVSGSSVGLLASRLIYRRYNKWR